ncbi:substrate-binding domain-containing protein [Halosolutus gelatinilyticus]|uniref:substrate-binding domain-containing protein n=1 Tax=Halosolutus gelatinilyticus TaxID=2931975 RepID=UPI002AAF652D|nr:substrate-binding domain-containing protein [Halosolutus gelatinilyticus]
MRSGDGAPSVGELTVGVTTSTYDSGLLDVLHAEFESRYGATVRAVSGGTGETIAHGERGDVDAVMAHARSLEDEFIRSGHGINRRDFTFGDFVVAGPPDDPAGIEELTTAHEAFARIAETEAAFLSRGDNSGTHVKELELWDAIGTSPTGEWYLETGQGMGKTLVQAGQRRAYLLTVRGNYIDMRDDLDLERFVEGPVTGGDPTLDNPYGIIVVNPARHPNVEYELAMLYTGFLTGIEGQRIIEDYTIDGKQVFYPDGLSEDPNFEQYSPANES